MIMEKYNLVKDSVVMSSNGEIIISKDTKLTRDNSINIENGAICKVSTGKYKGRRVLFCIDELVKIK